MNVKHICAKFLLLSDGTDEDIILEMAIQKFWYGNFCPLVSILRRLKFLYRPALQINKLNNNVLFCGNHLQKHSILFLGGNEIVCLPDMQKPTSPGSQGPVGQN